MPGIFPCKVPNPAKTANRVSLTENISGYSWNAVYMKISTYIIQESTQTARTLNI